MRRILFLVFVAIVFGSQTYFAERVVAMDAHSSEVEQALKDQAGRDQPAQKDKTKTTKKEVKQ